MLLSLPPPPVSTLNDCSVAKRRNSSLVSWMLSWYVGSLWPVHSWRYVLCLCGKKGFQYEMVHSKGKKPVVSMHSYLAKQVANADSGTCGPHTGSSPLHFVLAFWRAALSHSSLPRASLMQVTNQCESKGLNSSRRACIWISLYLTAARWQS